MKYAWMMALLVACGDEPAKKEAPKAEAKKETPKPAPKVEAPKEAPEAEAKPEPAPEAKAATARTGEQVYT